MSEELFGVELRFGQNYAGRDAHGIIRVAHRFGGTLMTRECAIALAKVLKPEFPRATPVELLRDDRDEIPMKSLEELGETFGLDKLATVVQQCLSQGFAPEQILLKCRNAIDAVEANVAKQNRLRELEQEAARLRAS